MSTLSELLQAENSKGLSARAVSQAARELGFTLNHDTAARYLRGEHGKPDEATLQAFSTVLSIPLAKLRRAAALPAEVTEPYRPPAEADRLNRRQRRAVDEVIRAMLQAPPASQQPVTELDTRRKGQSTQGKAARRGRTEPPSH
jgi:transcriptional regulator with XRE-family HTH domain